MSGYIPKALDKFQHPALKFPQHSHTNGTDQFMAAWSNMRLRMLILPPLDAKGMKQIQAIVSAFLYYPRNLEGPVLPALNDISTQQSAPTKLTIDDANWLMDFFHNYPNAKLRFFMGDMQLRVDSDAAYL
eukprot:5165403-Ditylum_brightwellii.AAC.1